MRSVVSAAVLLALASYSQATSAYEYECFDSKSPRPTKPLNAHFLTTSEELDVAVLPATPESSGAPTRPEGKRMNLRAHAVRARLGEFFFAVAQAQGVDLTVDPTVDDLPLSLFADDITLEQLVALASPPPQKTDEVVDVGLLPGRIQISRRKEQCGVPQRLRYVDVDSSLLPQIEKTAELLGVTTSAVEGGVLLEGGGHINTLGDFLAARPKAGPAAACGPRRPVPQDPPQPAPEGRGVATAAFATPAPSGARDRVRAVFDGTLLFDVSFAHARTDEVARALSRLLSVPAVVFPSAAEARVTLVLHRATLQDISRALAEQSGLSLTQVARPGRIPLALELTLLPPSTEQMDAHLLPPAVSSLDALAAVCSQRQGAEWASLLGDRVVYFASDARAAEVSTSRTFR